VETPLPQIINLSDAKAQLSRLIERAAAGEEIVIAKAGRPMARLVPVNTAMTVRMPGLLKGKISIGSDFDTALPVEIAAPFA
jgi:prevent-host-death family protein